MIQLFHPVTVCQTLIENPQTLTPEVFHITWFFIQFQSFDLMMRIYSVDMKYMIKKTSFEGKYF